MGFERGDWLTLDGSAGEVIRGSVPTVTPELGGAFKELMRWADKLRVVRVRTNADSPGDAAVAREFGAEGIGLCRTEHMFFEPSRILAMREMILAADGSERERALAKLLPMQRGDFVGIFRAMVGLPVTIRLLDPPLHEFLPHTDDEIREVASALGASAAALRAKVDEVREFNPMLGHRGCRLGVSFPEIYRMQVRAIMEAACDVADEGLRVQPEIMVPLVSHVGELSLLRPLIEDEIAAVRAARGTKKVRPKIGTMIEVPRAALTADEIAKHADFFSFGTNDLTQTAYALSRDDAGKFLSDYVDSGILSDDPFVSIDEDGIGRLMRTGTEGGRRTRPDLKVGICGEHGGDPKSVAFCASLGFDYVPRRHPETGPARAAPARHAPARAEAFKELSRGDPQGTELRAPASGGGQHAHCSLRSTASGPAAPPREASRRGPGSRPRETARRASSMTSRRSPRPSSSRWIRRWPKSFTRSGPRPERPRISRRWRPRRRPRAPSPAASAWAPGPGDWPPSFATPSPF